MSKPSAFEEAVVSDLRNIKACLKDGDRVAAMEKLDELTGACEEAWNVEAV